MMIYAASAAEVEHRRRAFIRKWRLKCKAVADSLEEAGDRLFSFTRLPSSQWKSLRTTNAIERLHDQIPVGDVGRNYSGETSISASRSTVKFTELAMKQLLCAGLWRVRARSGSLPFATVTVGRSTTLLNRPTPSRPTSITPSAAAGLSVVPCRLGSRLVLTFTRSTPMHHAPRCAGIS